MKKYLRIILLTLSLIMLMGVFATPAVACDDSNNLSPGYWKTHPEAWPVDCIEIGGVSYTKCEAIALMAQESGDKSFTMFRSVVAAKLNYYAFGADEWFIWSGDWWLYMNPVGSGVKARSDAWQCNGEQIYMWLDAFNNAMFDELFPY